MRTLRTANLIWEQRIRHTYPPAPRAVSDEGALLIAVPRPLEARTYDLTLLYPDWHSAVRTTFSVETLHKLIVTEAGSSFLGLTDDDLYLFRAGEKSRFLGEKRLNYIDADLSQSGELLAVVYTDMSGQNFGLACGETTGRVLWTEDLEIALSAVAMAPDGERLAAGAESGRIQLWSARRSLCWEFEQEEAVRALACSIDGARVAYGTRQGGVGLIAGDGARRWEVRLSGEVIGLALSADGDLCAALARHEDGTRLCLISDAGHVGWQYDTEHAFTSLALSSTGDYLAAGARDGWCALYALEFGAYAAAPGVARGDDAELRARKLLESGDCEEAYRVLQEALEREPASLPLFESWLAVCTAWEERRLGEARAQADAGDFLNAVETLDRMLLMEPHHEEALRLRGIVRKQAAAQALAQAEALQEAGAEPGAAAAALHRAISCAPRSEDARRALAALHAREAEEADREAERLLASGDLDGGIAALERAQAFAPDPERSNRRERALTAREYAAGMAAYHARSYQEAVFQFNKTLARDPDHAEARRYLNFARKFAQDTASDLLTDRFQRLE